MTFPKRFSSGHVFAFGDESSRVHPSLKMIAMQRSDEVVSSIRLEIRDAATT